MEQTPKQVWGLSLGLVFLGFCLGALATYLVIGTPHPNLIAHTFIKLSAVGAALGILASCFKIRWKLRKLQ